MSNTETFNHTCIKPDCSNTYSDTDPDAYYCESCKTAHQTIAKEIDRKVAATPKREQAGFEAQMAAHPKMRAITMINL